jgi:hypothetical protein
LEVGAGALNASRKSGSLGGASSRPWERLRDRRLSSRLGAGAAHWDRRLSSRPAADATDRDRRLSSRPAADADRDRRLSSRLAADAARCRVGGV